MYSTVWQTFTNMRDDDLEVQETDQLVYTHTHAYHAYAHVAVMVYSRHVSVLLYNRVV